MISEHPLVSIMCFCKDAKPTIDRCVQSVLAQTYPKIQFVVQDGASTDGTLEILGAYGQKIDLISEKDGGPSDAFIKALKRCDGEIIGSCLSDEELLPDAVALAVEQFRLHPHAGACIGGAVNVDLMTGNTQDVPPSDFDLIGFLKRTYVPHFPASFFRRSALEETNVFSNQTQLECLEAEMWIRLALSNEIRSFPGVIAKYGLHAGQLSHKPRRMLVSLKARLLMLDQLFGADGAFEGMASFLPYLHAHHIIGDQNHLRGFVAQLPAESREGLEEVLKEMDELLAKCCRDLNLSTFLPLGEQSWGDRFYRKLAGATPWLVRSVIPKEVKARMRSAIAKIGAPRVQSIGKGGMPDLDGHLALAIGKRLEDRGNVDACLSVLKKAASSRNSTIDSLACQAALKSPSYGNQELFDISVGWAHRWAALPWVRWEVRERKPDQKVRVGYMCSFWQASFAQFQILPFLRKHDKSRFQLIGIGRFGETCPDDAIFDEWVDTTALEGMDFVDHVRTCNLDVCVETTGFSQGHRFAELAHRCAPVQISYVNHNGTSGVPNIDYILADWNAAPEGMDRFYTEKIWRLPVPMFCFNYDGAVAPPVVDPPMLKKGSPTFGYFGSGGKLNLGVIEVWARLLRRIPGSTLYVRNAELSIRDNRESLAQRFMQFGIGRDRLRLDGGLPWEKLRQEYDHVDVSLDTWPYNGGNTISESLWQGVPVVTLRGETMAARYGASMLRDCGIEGLVGDSEDEYVNLAVRLVSDPERLRKIRYALRHASSEGTFRDAKRFAEAIEAAYFEMLGHPICTN
jgi:hypothetical protein